jgi:hypothetical protein
MHGLKESKGYTIIKKMMAAQDRQPFLFQEKTWEHINLTPPSVLFFEESLSRLLKERGWCSINRTANVIR